MASGASVLYFTSNQGWSFKYESEHGAQVRLGMSYRHFEQRDELPARSAAGRRKVACWLGSHVCKAVGRKLSNAHLVAVNMEITLISIFVSPMHTGVGAAPALAPYQRGTQQ